jgi:phage-related protein (TIGR01555 family)
MEQGKRRPNAGSFRPGQSGNPTGKPKRTDGDARTRVDELASKMDAWMNDLTGLGILGRDKTMGSASNTMFVPDIVDAETARQLWMGDGIAAKMIEAVPGDALRQGWEISIGDEQVPDRFQPPAPSSPGTGALPPGRRSTADARAAGVRVGVRGRATRRDAAEDDAGEAKALQEAITKQLTDLGVLGGFYETMCYERAYGGGAILLGANDFTTDLREPLDLSRVRSLDWLTPLEPRELIPRYFYNNPRAPKFGQPAIYQFVPYSVGPSIDNAYVPASTEIHESRLIIFPGVRVSRRLVTTNSQGWGDSILTRVVRALQSVTNGHQSAAVLLQGFSQAVYKVKDLAETIGVDGNSLLMAKITSIELMRSILRAVVVDADGEDFEYKTTALTGMPETLQQLMVWMAAVADMPVTKLWGTSATGLNATGKGDDDNWDDRIKSVQTLRVAPPLLRIVEILLRVMGKDPDAITHAIEFPPLSQPTGLELAQQRLAESQAALNYVNADIVSPEEVAPTLTDIYHIDFDARLKQEAVTAPPVDAKPPAPAPTGINALQPTESGTMPPDAKNAEGAPTTPPEE